ncbi:MAG: DNA mismatch repair protein MutS [Muribaculaceae bacterium]|nr:DNA mismatch repair protein MutS [Muribaculaceae bacterium]
MGKKIAETPLMTQYAEMKKKHPDAILLFRVGDFYETFCDDAIAASEILGITLTRRANGKAASIELAGFPHHALDAYLPKLVRAGRRVAICEQLEDPKLTKKLVKRGITELITPGINTGDSSLPSRQNNFLAGVHFLPSSKGHPEEVGVAFLDITTGEFLCTQGSAEYVDKLLNNIMPAEVLRMRGTRQKYESVISLKTAVNEMDDWVFNEESARERLLRHFNTVSLKGFGVDDLPGAVIAAGALIHYLDYTKHTHIRHIATLNRIDASKYVRLDRFTIRNLELVKSLGEQGKSLLDIIDKTLSPMGGRTLRRWLLFPLLDIEEIKVRHDGVEYFFRDPDFREAATVNLSSMGDLERMISRLATHRISGRELLALADSLSNAMMLRRAMSETSNPTFNAMAGKMADCNNVISIIRATIHPNSPSINGKGPLIASGVSEELDRLRSIASGGKSALAEIQQREIDKTGITSLKIGFNNVFGYYIEVRNTHREKVPADWIRKQTLVSAERYITPELKEYEETIIGAEDKIASIEADIFNQLLNRLGEYVADMGEAARMAGRTDALLSMAIAAEDYKYVRPVVDDSLNLDITEGRHPVIERRLPPGESYIANDVHLNCDSEQIMILTGPNMSGKSALLRQTALIVLMAQIGSFVPAKAARIGLIDKIFTRVGASDNISEGESTFMVEMNESASILNNMSERSLILFDELGRGTSTYDGISIAWSIVEYIHENGNCRPKTLFATHYHELNEMEKSFRRIVNYNVAVKEIGGKVVFMRKLERGGSAHSFGIHVARLAGMPPSIVKRADQVLSQLESASKSPEKSGSSKSAPTDVCKADVSAIGRTREGYQLSIFQLDDPLLMQIRDRLLNISIDTLTPLQALTTLHDLQSLLTGKE